MTRRSFCSPTRPWGLHPSIQDNLCPRCGWTARERPEPEVQDGDPPARGAKPAA